MINKNLIFAQFAKGLFDPDMSAPEGVVGLNGQRSKKRYDVYRNNVTHSLITALADNHFTTSELAGPIRFNSAALTYVRQFPATSTIMFEYGDEFCDFLEVFPPAVQQMPFLGSVARFDWAGLKAYHAFDDIPLDPHVLTQIEQDDLPNLRLHPADAMHVVTSEYAICDLFERVHSNPPPSEGPIKQRPQAVLITRPDTKVLTFKLNPAQTVFFEELQHGNTLGLSAERAYKKNRKFDINEAIGIALSSGAFCRYTILR